MEKAQQTSKEQRDALDTFKDILVKKEVLAHKDKVRWAASLQRFAFATQGCTWHTFFQYGVQQIISGTSIADLWAYTAGCQAAECLLSLSHAANACP